MKLVLALFALMLAIGFATLWIWRLSPAQAPCAAREIAQERAPGGRTQADVFEVSCGASVSTHVALRPAGAAEEARSDVFIAAGSVPVRVRWISAREVAVDSPAARVLAAEARWRDVVVRTGPPR